MYKIHTSSNVPDSTYFRLSSVSPEVQADGSIVIWNGRGTRRSWGAPETTSTVVVNWGDFCAVHVGFHHKHRGGQGWAYFVAGQRRTWAQLTPAQQRRVVKAYRLGVPPSWAAQPGRIKGDPTPYRWGQDKPERKAS